MRWILIAIFIVFTGVIEAADDSRVAVPDVGAQGKAKKVITSLFDDLIKDAKTPAQRISLAERMFAEARISTDSSSSIRYMMFLAAREHAIAALNHEVALRIVAETAKRFRIDELKERAAVLEAIGRSPKSDAAKLLGVVTNHIESAISEENFHVASQLSRTGVALSRRTRDVNLQKKQLTLSNDIRRIQQMHARLATAFHVIDEEPDDPLANKVIGEYACFVRGDWATGLPSLAKSNDARLNSIAKAEVAGPESADQQAEIGKMWADYAKREKGMIRSNIQQRAARWYRLALPRLDGLARKTVEVRLKELNEIAAVTVRPSAVSRLEIEVLIDGHDELHLTRKTLWWVSKGDAKPGLHRGTPQPTTVNGKAWQPKWRKAGARGADRTEPLAINLKKLDFRIKVISITNKRGQTGIAKRSPIKLRHEKEKLVVSIPDPQGGSMWYRFMLY